MDPVFSRPKFGPMPSGYVPGVGRGAVPFFTRSDIGNAASPGFMINPTLGTRGHEHDRDRGDYSDSLFDRWNGFKDTKPVVEKNDPEDDEADKIYADVDEFMDSRRKRHREKSVLDIVAKKRKPTVASLFADVRESLRTVTPDQWNAIPVVKPHARKKVKQAKKVPITDRVLYEALTEGQTTSTDQSCNSDAVGSVMTSQLDRVGGIKTAAPSVDPVGYITEMNAMKVSSEEEIRDLKKLRTLVKSLVDTNPTHSEGWLTAARVEEKDGKLAEARALLSEGLIHCPDAEDLWLESARLAPVSQSREMLVKGTMALPHSIKLWLALASKSEADRLATLRQGLQINPESVRLWKEVVQLAEPEDARMYLRKAITCVPQSLELWLALARLENYENAKAVLSKARKLMPAEFVIWTHAAKLEEANGNIANVPELISRGLRTLAKASVPISRATWFQEALTAEQAGSPLTATAIIVATINTGLEMLEKPARWLEDADMALKSACVECAREVLAAGQQVMPDSLELWRGRISLEKRVGGAGLEAIYRGATEQCGNDVALWLEFADYEATRGALSEALHVLETAVARHPASLPLHLKLSRLYQVAGDFVKSRSVLLQCECGKAWKRAALLDLAEGRDAEQTLQQGICKYPGYARLYLILANVQSDLEAKRSTLERAMESCGACAKVWIAAERFEETQSPIKARYLLEKARRHCNDPQLWLESALLEQRLGNAKQAKALLTEGLKRFPTSGALWAEAVKTEERNQRKPKLVDALEKCPESAELMVEAANAFWEDRKIEKARLWFEKSLACARKWGDAAILFYFFESQQPDSHADHLLSRLNTATFKHGLLWEQTDPKKTTAERIEEGAHLARQFLLRQ